MPTTVIQDTAPGQLDHAPNKRKVVWDFTINLGHLISFGMGLIAVVGIFIAMDKRITKTEGQAEITAAAISSLSAEVKEVKSAVDRVSTTLAVQAAVNEAVAKVRK